MADAPPEPSAWAPPDVPAEAPGWAPPESSAPTVGTSPPAAGPPPPVWGAPGQFHPYAYGAPPQPEYAVPLAPKFRSRRWWACMVAIVAIGGSMAYLVANADLDSGRGFRADGDVPTYAPGWVDPGGAPPDADGRLETVRMCTSVGPVDVAMPRLVGMEGPRPLRNIASPATGTFATSYADGTSFRYDAVVIEGVSTLYSSEEIALPAVVSNLDGDPASVTTSDVGLLDGVGLGLTFTERYDGRSMVGTALTSRGVIVIVSIGVPSEKRSVDTDLDARDLLQAFQRSIVLPGPSGMSAATCVPSTP